MIKESLTVTALAVTVTALAAGAASAAPAPLPARTASAAAPASAARPDTDVLNLVNAKRIPVSVLDSGNTAADGIVLSNVEQTGLVDDGPRETADNFFGSVEMTYWQAVSGLAD